MPEVTFQSNRFTIRIRRNRLHPRETKTRLGTFRVKRNRIVYIPDTIPVGQVSNAALRIYHKEVERKEVERSWKEEVASWWREWEEHPQGLGWDPTSSEDSNHLDSPPCP